MGLELYYLISKHEEILQIFLLLTPNLILLQLENTSCVALCFSGLFSLTQSGAYLLTDWLACLEVMLALVIRQVRLVAGAFHSALAGSFLHLLFALLGEVDGCDP